MTCVLRYAAVFGLMLLCAAPLTPQQNGERTADPVIRVTVDLVQVDAVVTDSRGDHVSDLRPERFQILEDGKRHPITHFSWVPGTAPRGGSTPVRPASRKTPGGNAEPPQVPVKALRPEEVRRTIVLMADDLGLPSDGVPAVRAAMKNFVDREMQPGDLASIVTTSGGMGTMQQLTNDRHQLLALIDRIHWSPGRTGLTWYDPVRPADAASGVESASNRRLNSVRRPLLGFGTTGALARAIQGLREMPGRKAIALFSDGFTPNIDGIVELANRASVVIYTLDPRGHASFFLSAVDFCKPPFCNVRAEEAKRQATYGASQTSLDQLARRTGGIFFHDDNDLTQGLTNALNDIGGYYLLGYRPQRDEFESVRGLPKFHKIEVKVLGSGLHVRSRDGFSGTPDPPPAMDQAAPRSGKQELRKALDSPFQANGFPVRLNAFYSASPLKDPKTGRSPASLRAMLAIDAHGLRFSDAPDGGKQLNLDIVAAAYGADNEVVAGSDKTFSATMTTDEMNQIIASGLVYNLDIVIPRPGPYQLRVAAWDANGERAGSTPSSATIFRISNLRKIAVAGVQ